jgi:hypothetical protein
MLHSEPKNRDFNQNCFGNAGSGAVESGTLELNADFISKGAGSASLLLFRYFADNVNAVRLQVQARVH